MTRSTAGTRRPPAAADAAPDRRRVRPARGRRRLARRGPGAGLRPGQVGGRHAPAARRATPRSSRRSPPAASCARTCCGRPGTSCCRPTSAGCSRRRRRACRRAAPTATGSWAWTHATLGRADALLVAALRGGEPADARRGGGRADRRRESPSTASGSRTSSCNAELDAVICSGPRHGKQHTYVLLDERAPDARDLPRDEALAELARRYFTSHGPATATDFATWASLTLAEVRAARRGGRSGAAARGARRPRLLVGRRTRRGGRPALRRRSCASCRATTSTSWATRRRSA